MVRSPQEARVFIGNLASERVSKQDIHDVFSIYGPIIEDIVMRKSYGFIQFATAEAARAAIEGENGRVMGGLRLDLNLAGGGKKRERNEEGEAANPAALPQGGSIRGGGRGGGKRTEDKKGGRRRKMGSGGINNSVSGREGRDDRIGSSRIHEEREPQLDDRDSFRGPPIPIPIPIPISIPSSVLRAVLVVEGQVDRKFVELVEQCISTINMEVDINFVNRFDIEQGILIAREDRKHALFTCNPHNELNGTVTFRVLKPDMTLEGADNFPVIQAVEEISSRIPFIFPPINGRPFNSIEPQPQPTRPSGQYFPENSAVRYRDNISIIPPLGTTPSGIRDVRGSGGGGVNSELRSSMSDPRTQNFQSKYSDISYPQNEPPRLVDPVSGNGEKSNVVQALQALLSTLGSKPETNSSAVRPSQQNTSQTNSSSQSQNTSSSTSSSSNYTSSSSLPRSNGPVLKGLESNLSSSGSVVVSNRGYGGVDRYPPTQPSSGSYSSLSNSYPPLSNYSNSHSIGRMNSVPIPIISSQYPQSGYKPY